MISGLYAPDGGSVALDGQAIGDFAAQGRAYLGINRTFQVPKPIMSLTVRQNIAVPLALVSPGWRSRGAGRLRFLVAFAP